VFRAVYEIQERSKIMASRSPKKRKASKDKAKTTFQVEDPNPTGNPIVVSFPGGIPESVQNGEDTGRPKFLWQKRNQKSSFGRKLTGEDKHCVYSSQSQGLGYDDRRTKLCIGVYDKKRGVVVLREAASRGTVFALEQSVPSYIEKNGEVEAEPGKGLLYSTQVYQDFGSSKKQKVIKSQAANQVDIDHVVGAGAGSAVMQQVMKGASMSESNRKAIAEESKIGGSSTPMKAVDTAYEVARRNFLPVYDENAVKPDKVYSAKDIAGDRAWTKVYKRVDACSHKDDITDAIVGIVYGSDWYPSVRKIVDEVSPESKFAKDRFTCALLLNWLIKFYDNNHKRRTIPTPNETKATYYGIPVEVASRWVTNFTTSVAEDDGKVSHAMSKQNKDKCIVHALLLFMMAQGNTMKISSIKPIAEDMKVPVNDCAQMLRLAGCTITKKAATLSAALKTPLTFPQPKRGGGRGR
jgi:hypothetical protein